MALFLVFSILIGSQIAVRNLLTDGRRDKEIDMIWRGNQYVRAIRLYYRKTGHYPQTIDDLEKGMPELHFLRLAAYKDPMNSDDGSWRFIYVNGAGQIIGSVKFASLQQMAFIDLGGNQPGAPVIPGAVPASVMASSSSGASASPSSTFSSGSSTTSSDSGAPASPDSSQSSSAASTDSSSTSAGTQSSGTGQGVGGNSPSPAGSGFGSGFGSASSSPFESPSGAAPGGAGGLGGLTSQSPIASQKPTGPVDGPVLGGFLTGVGSKVDRSSVKVYKGGKKYNEWEFIWNPLEDQARAVQQGLSGGAGSGTPGLGLPGASPIGGASGAAGAGSGFGSPMGGASGFGGSQPGTPIGSSSPQPQSQQ